MANPMAIFEIADSKLNTVTPDIFGLWKTAPAPPSAAGVSFSTIIMNGKPADEEIPVWRAILPPDSAQAHHQLSSGQQLIETSRGALPAARQRIETITHYARSQAQGISFAPPALDPDEQALLDVLRQVEGAGEETLSFGIRETVMQGWEDLQQVQALADQLRQSVASYIRIETDTDKHILAQTLVGWTGDFRTTWSPGTTREHMELHTRTLKLALTSRDTLLQTLQQTIKLLFLVSTPGGAIVALPAAWKLINRILKQEQGEGTHGN